MKYVKDNIQKYEIIWLINFMNYKLYNTCQLTSITSNCNKLPLPEKYDVTGILVLKERVMKELENNMESHCICVSWFIA